MWDSSLESGIELVDQQHKKYFHMVNAFLDTLDQRKQMYETFEFLKNYVKEHFSTEESLMVDFKYPDYKHHWQQHRFFRDKITLMSIKLKEIEDAEHATDLPVKLDFILVDWFVNHIKATDKKLCKFLQEESKKNKTLSHRLQSLLQKFLSG